MPLFLVRLATVVPVVATSSEAAVDCALADRQHIIADREIDAAYTIRQVKEPKDLPSAWLDAPPYGQMPGVELTCRQILEAEVRQPTPPRYCILLTGRDKRGRPTVEVLGRDTRPTELMGDALPFDSPEEAKEYIRTLARHGKVQTVAPLDGPWTVPLPGAIPTTSTPATGG